MPLCCCCGFVEKYGVIFGDVYSGDGYQKAFACERCLWKGFLFFSFKRVTMDGYNQPLETWIKGGKTQNRESL